MKSSVTNDIHPCVNLPQSETCFSNAQLCRPCTPSESEPVLQEAETPQGMARGLQGISEGNLCR